MHEVKKEESERLVFSTVSFPGALSLEKMKVLGGEVRGFGRAALLEELSEAVIGPKGDWTVLSAARYGAL